MHKRFKVSLPVRFSFCGFLITCFSDYSDQITLGLKKIHEIGRNIPKGFRTQTKLNIWHSVSLIIDTLFIHYSPNITKHVTKIQLGS